MICELCGNPFTDGFRLQLEGSQVNACLRCKSHGNVVNRVSDRRRKPAPERKAKNKGESFEVAGELEVREGWERVISAARQRKGWTQAELGMKVNEPESVIHRIESGRMEPSPQVAGKLEKKLGIRLLVKSDDDEAGSSQKALDDLTLGDMVVIRKRGK